MAKTLNEWNEEFDEIFFGLRAGSIDVKLACEASNAYGKRINAAKLELLYSEQKKETPKIPFLDYKKEKQK